MNRPCTIEWKIPSVHTRKLERSDKALMKQHQCWWNSSVIFLSNIGATITGIRRHWSFFVQYLFTSYVCCQVEFRRIRGKYWRKTEVSRRNEDGKKWSILVHSSRQQDTRRLFLSDLCDISQPGALLLSLSRRFCHHFCSVFPYSHYRSAFRRIFVKYVANAEWRGRLIWKWAGQIKTKKSSRYFPIHHSSRTPDVYSSGTCV